MRRMVIIMLLSWSCVASAATYYVSSSTGSDTNSGTSTASAWQTIAHVNGQTFFPGDSLLFKRGDVWNESLTPPSSGSSGNPITFDAYGAGAAPNLTGYYAVPAGAWVLVTGNAWKAPAPATYSTINFCLFGSVWGQKVAAATSNLTAQWNFYLASGFIYVYSVGSPATYYNEAIVPMALSNAPVININGKSWLTFQHFLLNWFDQYGVYVQGTSDHLVFANMEADSMIPQGTQPLGFYVNETAPGPGDIKIYNAEAHLNYDGFRFDGAATAITMVNDKAYGNRDGALVDNTSAVTYSYCHFYASSLAVAGSTDVEWVSGTGPIAGTGNIAQDTAPAVQLWQRYPAEVTLTVDDAGMTAGADTYYSNTVLPIADAAGVPVGTAVTVGYPLAQTLTSEFQGWVNAGRDVTSHSMSHTYYTNTDALEIQYTGSGTAATLSISGKMLTITVTGASDGVNYNLAQNQSQGTIKALRLALLATGKFTATEVQTCQGPYGTGCSAYTESALLAQDLADVSGQNVKSSVYHMLLDVTRLTTDEITLSRQWMTANLTGLPATPVYVYPGGYETTAMQGITAGVPYAGARGALKEDLGVRDTYADGFNVQNITSFGVNPSWQGLPPASLNQKIQALVWKQEVWGAPWGIFWHLNELTNSDPVGGTEITNLIRDFKASGATIQTNTGLVNWLMGGTQVTGTDGNFYYVQPANSMALDFRPTKNSPVVDVGENLGTEYALDINGVNQNSYGTRWEIGAHVFQGYATYGEGAGTGTFKIGLPTGAPVYSSTTSTANPGTLTPLFTGTTGVNQVAYDTTYNPSPLDPYTRVTDSTTLGGASVGNNTCSGGSNDYSWSKNSDFLGFSEGGAFWILNLNTTGAAAQVINTGAIGSFHVLCPAVFSRVTDNVIWNVSSNHTTIQKNVITTSPYGFTTTTVMDLSTCPGLPSGVTWTWNGILSVSNNDNRFSMDLGFSGGQDTGTWQVTYDSSLGQCSSVNVAGGPDWVASTPYTGSTINIITPLTGNAGGYSYEIKTTGTTGSSAPTWTQTPGAIISDGTMSWTNVGVGGVEYGFGSSSPTSLPTANTCTTGSNCNCWGGAIHDGQMFGDGNHVMITEWGVWAYGACAGVNVGTMLSIWQTGSSNTQFCQSNPTGLGGQYCGGHGSMGTTLMLNAESTAPANFRSSSNVLTFTNFEIAPAVLGAHGFWPQPDQADDYPYIQATYGITSGQGTGCANGAYWCPINNAAAISAIYPGNVGAYPPGQARTFFGHTYSCGAPSDSASCPGGAHDFNFGCQDAVISVSQDGNWVALPSGMLLSLGLDSSSKPRCDLFVIHIGM